MEWLSQRRSAAVQGGPHQPLAERLHARLRRHAEHARHRRQRKRIKRVLGELGVETVVVRSEAFRGSFELPASSSLAVMLLSGDFEPGLAELMARLLTPGDQFVDVGANVGLYSVLGAALTGGEGRVLSVEPIPEALRYLRANLWRNGVETAEVVAGALSDAPGPRTIHAVAGSPEYSSLGAIVHPHAPAVREDVRVQCETLDLLVARHGLAPGLVKMDVEGAEGLVLAGAVETLRRHRPAVLAEVDDRLLAQLGRDAGGVVRALEDTGYQVFDVASGRTLLPARLTRPFIGEVLALPAEQCPAAGNEG